MTAIEKIKRALSHFGIEAKVEDCDVCTDGSVWWGLVMILPKGSVSSVDV
jgi:hypothetical protein